jgi:isopenicillin N synthase-like dioxygenase
VKDVSDSLLAMMAKNLGLKREAITDKCIHGMQSVRTNYYPPCAQAEKVVGLSPHSDAGLLTLVLQVNHVQGLQIKRNGSWLPVKPVSGAFIVNIGDMFEVSARSRTPIRCCSLLTTRCCMSMTQYLAELTYLFFRGQN